MGNLGMKRFQPDFSLHSSAYKDQNQTREGFGSWCLKLHYNYRAGLGFGLWIGLCGL